jgi:hypothetical protein
MTEHSKVSRKIRLRMSYAKKQFHKYKKLGICTSCKKAPAIPNKCRCLECNKQARINSNLADSKEAVELISKQGGYCAICSNLMTNKAVDHDHKTGKLRGILCYQCNSGLGMFKDNIETMKKAINYLEKHLV